MTYADQYGRIFKHIGVAKDVTDRFEMMLHLENRIINSGRSPGLNRIWCGLRFPD